MTVKSIDELIKKLKPYAKKAVYVGFPKEHNPDVENGFIMADLGAVHEFGSEDGRIPKRPFLRPTVSENSEKYTNLFIKQVRTSTPVPIALERISLMVQADAVQKINEGNFKPLAPVTIAKKGSSKPLIDTGRMRQSIRGVVRDEN